MTYRRLSRPHDHPNAQRHARDRGGMGGYSYNRIHMTNHFLSDVCFGSLITYLIYAGISAAFLRAAEKK